MAGSFERVLAAFRPDENIYRTGIADAASLAQSIQERFLVDVPSVLVEFWSQVGGGYFADRELFVFCDDAATSSRDSLIAWNSMDYWSRVFPTPQEGGPIFFAETCFGMQLGFRWDNGVPIGYLLDVDTLEAFRVADDCDDLFMNVLTDRYAFTDPELLKGVRGKLGPLPEGRHYAPIVSPLAGGPLEPENYHLETPNVHLRTSVAAWEAVRATKGKAQRCQEPLFFPSGETKGGTPPSS